MFIMLSFATYTKLINFIVKENHSEHTLVGPLRYWQFVVKSAQNTLNILLCVSHSTIEICFTFDCTEEQAVSPKHIL